MSDRRPRWGQVATIFRREVRDQVRDKRTLFMVFVLPLLLYPILGIGVLQLSTAFEQKPRLVVVVGVEDLPPAPPLLNAGRDGFAPDLFGRPQDAEKIRVRVEAKDSPWLRPEAIRSAIQAGVADAVVTIPADIGARVEAAGSVPVPIRYDSSDEISQITYLRVRDVIDRWRDAIVQARLKHDGKSPDYTEPVAARGEDVAPEGEAGGSIWGRLFPFLLVIMALTGAFYPAIDLCAGEKERGTMETLLLSPASRTEIVLGKFLTVMLASITTAALNLVSMGLTGIQIAGQVANLGPTRSGAKMAAVLSPPHPASYFWMMLLLIPLAAFFSALCVALAVLARSMKEGQYYMTPLYLVSLPLILVTLAPEIKLDLFYSLVPITGASLLLKTLILGEYATARAFFLPVLIPTLVYAGLALRWAVDLFGREDVIFRESEVFDPRLWVRQLIRDRETTPGAGVAVFAFALMISLTWFVSLAVQGKMSMLAGLVTNHLLAIVGPAVGLAWAFSSDPGRTLRLRRPRPADLALAAGVAVALNPSIREVGAAVSVWFPISPERAAAIERLTGQIPGLGASLLVLALMPALTEELAFRGLILSGLQRRYRPATAVLGSAFLFAFLHAMISLFQQFFPAALLGLALGLIAYRTASLWSGVVLHFASNALAVVTPEAIKAAPGRPLVGWLFRDEAQALYRWPIVVIGVVLAAGMLAAIGRREPVAAGAGRAEPVVA